MITPRYYQQEATDKIIDYLSYYPGKHPLVAMPTGSGKSLVIAMLIEFVRKEWNAQVLILSHTEDILKQDYKQIRKLISEPIGLYSAGLKSRTILPITVAGIQSVYRKPELFAQFDLVIIDECFTGDTLIKTEKGLKRIDKVSCNDVIYTATGKGKIQSISKKQSNNILTLRLSNGKSIETTNSHPIFTEHGWKDAQFLARNEKIFCIQDMRKLQYEIQTSKSQRKEVYGCKILLNILLEKERERNVGSWRKRKNDRNLKENWSSPCLSWRKWKTIDRCTISNEICFRGWVGDRVGNTYKNKEIGKNISNMLQSRYWKQRFKNCDRSRWIESCGGKEKIRLQKRRISNKIRVESVQNEKSGSYRSVYNLQIQGHPSFYAGGILVHNCHMINTIDDSMYRSFLSEVGQAYVGLTATPYRLSTGLIYGKDNTLFDDLVYDLTSLSNFNKLIAEGYLCNLKTMQTQLEFDTSLLHHRGGEFIESEMSSMYNQAEITKLAVKEIVKIGTENNYKKWLIFAIDISHAESIAEEFIKLGIPTGIVHSKMEDEKVVVLEKHRSNKFRALVNVNMLTTGYDDAEIDLIGMLRPTESPVLHVQTVGRGTRVSPGKDHCMVLDFAGNTKRLGPINNITIKEHYKLKDGTGTPITKTCPECQLIVAPALKVCECGYEFQFKTKLDSESTGFEIIATDTVKYEVDNVIYALYSIPSGIMTFKASYRCLNGFKVFTELFCLDHSGYARSRAVAILTVRGAVKEDLVSCETAIKIVDKLTQPSHIMISNAKRYPEIKRYYYENKNK